MTILKISYNQFLVEYVWLRIYEPLLQVKKYLSYDTSCGWELRIEKYHLEFLSYATSTHENSFIGENFKFLGRMEYWEENIFHYFR